MGGKVEPIEEYGRQARDQGKDSSWKKKPKKKKNRVSVSERISGKDQGEDKDERDNKNKKKTGVIYTPYSLSREQKGGGEQTDGKIGSIRCWPSKRVHVLYILVSLS